MPSSRHNHHQPTNPDPTPHPRGTQHVGTATIRALVEAHPRAAFVHLITLRAPHPDQNDANPFFEKMGFTSAKPPTHLFEIDPTAHVYMSAARHTLLSRTAPILSPPSTTQPPLIYLLPSPQPNTTHGNPYHPDITNLLNQSKSWHHSRCHGIDVGDQADPWAIVRMAHTFCVAYPHDIDAYTTYVRDQHPPSGGSSLLLPPPTSETFDPVQHTTQQDTSASIDAVLNINPAGPNADSHTCVYLAPTHKPLGDG